MESTQGVILLLADISGYTRFIRQHQAASHARMIIVRLLKALVEASKPLFELAEIEGDAVFLFTSVPEGNPEAFASRVKQKMLTLFLQFNEEVRILQQIQQCKCEACSSVGDLKLKQVLHQGEVAIEQIDRFEKLFGLDVIVVHRMLKNSVEASEYVMMTDPVYRSFGDFHGIEPERRIEQFEGIGAVETFVFYTSTLLEELVRTAPQRTPRSSTGWIMKLRARSLVDFFRSHLGQTYSDEEEAFTGAAHPH
jgi:class 3 adenylate cyclase